MPDKHALKMDAAAWHEPLVVVEEEKYARQMPLKNALLSGKDALLSGADRQSYVQCPLDAQPLAWEALELLLPDAARH